MSVGWSVGRSVTHSFDDPHVAPTSLLGLVLFFPFFFFFFSAIGQIGQVFRYVVLKLYLKKDNLWMLEDWVFFRGLFSLVKSGFHRSKRRRRFSSAGDEKLIFAERRPYSIM